MMQRPSVAKSMKMSLPRNAAGVMSLPRGGSIAGSMMGRNVSEGGRAGGVRDPRPVSDKSTQRDYSTTIFQWLLAHNYEMTKSMKALSAPIMSPSQSDVFSIVEFIYSKTWSPNFRLANYPEPVEGVLSVFRCLKYPFQIPKSNLTSIAPHNIGAILGAIVWLVELAELDEEQGMGPTTTKRRDEEETVDQLWMNYLAESFRAAGKPQVIQRLDDGFKEQLRQQLSVMEDAVKELERQSSELKRDIKEQEDATESANVQAAELERHINSSAAEIQKLDVSAAQTAQNNAELEGNLVARRQELDAAIAQLQETTKEKERLEALVAMQDFSPAERERILKERQSLQKHLQDTMAMKEQRSRDVADAEMFVSRKIDEIERRIQKYQETLVRLSLLREDPKLSVALSSSTPAAEEELREHLRTVVKPALAEMAKGTESDTSKEVDEQLVKEERLLRTKERLQELEAQYERLEGELRAVEKRTAELKEKSDTDTRQQEEILMRIKKECSDTKEQARQELTQVQAAHIASSAEIAREHEVQRQERMQWEAALMEVSNALVDHKAFVHKSLEELVLDSRRMVEESQQQQPQQQPSFQTPSARRPSTPGRPIR